MSECAQPESFQKIKSKTHRDWATIKPGRTIYKRIIFLYLYKAACYIINIGISFGKFGAGL